MDRPNPMPLPGDLRVVQLSGRGVGERLAGRWQVERYDPGAGRWRAVVDRAGGRVELTFGAEDSTLAYLLTVVRHSHRR